MKKWLLGMTAVALGALGVLSDGGVVAGDATTPTCSEIMKKVNGKGGLHKALPTALKANPVDWAGVQKQTKEYSELAANLGKNDPPKGEKASWQKLTKTYADGAKNLHTAVEKKDKDAALMAHGAIGKMCMNCHRTHRE
jgi:cytochrome c556